MRPRCCRWLTPFLLVGLRLFASPPAPAPQAFLQEVALHHDASVALPKDPVQLLDPGPDGSLRAFSGVSWKRRDGRDWVDAGTLSPAPKGFSFVDAAGAPQSASIDPASVRQILRGKGAVFLVTARDVLQWSDKRLLPSGWSQAEPINQAALDPAGAVVVASPAGLFTRSGNGFVQVHAVDASGRDWAFSRVLGVGFDSLGQLWFATPAGVGCRTAAGWVFRDGRDGLPWNEFTGIASGPSGEMWFSTRMGAIRWDGSGFHYRQGPRWLPSDDVRQVAVDRDGTAWFATAAGLGAIVRRPMTLQAKADFYEAELAQYIQRTPFGYCAEAPLRRPGDRTSASPDDSDNDGLWTAMYGAGECLAFGATRSPAALGRARKAFTALRFLQDVTQGGPLSPPPGFVARTIRPVEWPDPNVGRLEQDVEERKHDALWKVYEPRWPRSADGKWYWKGDTSSDELDGHYFFYALYHDLAAEGAEDKAQVRLVVQRLTDHLLDHDFQLVDHDGKPTRWGVYSPRELNRNPLWWAERGLNSLSILTYLTVAEHVTGDARYTKAIRTLMEQHGFAQNLMFPKVQRGPGSGNHSDDEMAFMCFYTLLRLTREPTLLSQVRYAFFEYWSVEQPEMNPFFDFAYASQNLDQQVTNGWGTFPVSPWPGWHEDSMATLRGFPLDRLNWPSKNSHRLDVVRLPRFATRDLYDNRSQNRGHRTNGKVLPVENRHFEHWNTDPWDLDYLGSGNVLASGTVFLLPYYLGLHHGYIAKP